MTLYFLESFDVYGTGGYGLDLLGQKWNEMTGSQYSAGFDCDLDEFSSTINRNKEYSPSYSLKLLSESANFDIDFRDVISGVWGFAVYFAGDKTSAGYQECIRYRDILSCGSLMRDSNTKHLIWNDYVDGGIDYVISGTTVIENNKWYYIEMEFFASEGGYDAPEGACKLWIDGELEGESSSGIRTSRVAGEGYRTFSLLSADSSDELVPVYFDDFYLISKAGTLNNQRLGDVTVRALSPNGSDSPSELVGQDGDSTNNYQNVDDAPADDGTTHNSGLTSSATDVYSFHDVGNEVATIYGIQLINRVKEEVNGTRVFAPVSRPSGCSISVLDYQYTLNDSYQYFQHILETDECNVVPWDQNGLHHCEFGIRIE